MPITIEVSPGELIDRITILELKVERIEDPDKLENVRHELALLVAVRDRALETSARLTELSDDLRAVNDELWKVEDDIRDHERCREFGAEFIALARSVYRLNDHRAALKKEINLHLDSGIVEEKSYTRY